MKQIVNVSKNWAIGKKGQLRALIPEDMKFFRRKTSGKVCVMGSTTLESFPGMAPLQGRVNIVLIDDPAKIRPESLRAAQAEKEAGRSTELIYVHSVPEALLKIEEYVPDDVYVIGGATIYRLLLPYCDTCYVTHNYIDDPDADTFYPDLLKTGEWARTETGEEQEQNGIRFRFCTYTRIR